ncbi:50S ribosomal protein L22 [Chloroflexota bacterium]
MEVKAIAKHIRVSPRKVRLVLDTVRGKKVEDALTILSFLPIPMARTVAKVVKSAASNAENNYQMSPERLKIVKTYADGERTMKRFRANARGRASPYRRRLSQITVIVEEK